MRGLQAVWVGRVWAWCGYWVGRDSAVLVSATKVRPGMGGRNWSWCGCGELVPVRVKVVVREEWRAVAVDQQ